MRTNKTKIFNEQEHNEIELAISNFSEHLMSNSKWIRLIEKFVKNIDKVKTIEFKKINKDIIGQLYLNKDTTFELDYWENGFEGNNSLGGWLTFKEIEYLIFPRIVDFNNNIEQDLHEIMKIINSTGQFNLEYNKNWLKLSCYK